MFAKVFTQIFDSSIAEDYQVRLVFEDFLKLADKNGVVDMTPEAISRRTNVPLEIVTKGINALQAPDPRSRNPESDGRRIVLLDDHRDWGWLVVNYQSYRELASEEQRRQKTLERVRKHREKPPVTPCNAPVTPVNASNAMQRQRQKEMEKSTHTPLVNSVPVLEVEQPTGVCVGSGEEDKPIPKRPNGNGQSTFQRLKEELSMLYGRALDQRWPHLEEHALSLISRRAGVLGEWSRLRVYRSKLESPKYFPNSIARLLENWQSTLDAASTHKESRKKIINKLL